MKECRFCKIIAAKSRVVWENDSFFARFDHFPVSPGHILMIPKRHVVSLFDLNKLEKELFVQSIIMLKEVVEQTNLEEIYKEYLSEFEDERMKPYFERMLNSNFLNQEPDGYNIGVNEGAAAGRTIDHLHVQIIPRYEGDKRDAVGGIRQIFLEFANYTN